jgi:hypothetical protein
MKMRIRLTEKDHESLKKALKDHGSEFLKDEEVVKITRYGPFLNTPFESPVTLRKVSGFPVHSRVLGDWIEMEISDRLKKLLLIKFI